MDDRLGAMPAVEMVQHFARKALSPVEVHEAVQAVIERAEPVLNAFWIRDQERSRKATAASEQRWIRGETLGAS
jgi:aspartyl-tRNA(Asn)/glutamyl-tRNA(Gln) amidotransferase subunit A